MTDEQERALAEFRRVSKAVGQGLGFRGGVGAEKAYSQAYQHLVRLGLAMQLKKKYR